MTCAPGKILVRGVNWLGDAVMSTPALLRLRERFPNAQITVLTPEKLGPLYLNHPAVDRILMFSSGDSVLAVASWLRAEDFDLGVIFPNSPRTALEMWLGRVRRRIGYARPWRTWMLTDGVTEPADLPKMRKRSPAEARERIAAGASRESYDVAGHHLHHYLRLVAALGCNPSAIPPLLRVTADEVRDVAAKFKIACEAPLLALNAGAEYGAAKRWPEERFIAAAIALHSRTGCRWLVLGGRGDTALAERITAAISKALGTEQVRNIAGQTSLRELCAALKHSDLLLTNDTGPMHVAAALGTPVIVPFGSTSPELTGPGLPGHGPDALILGSAACAPCFLRECPVDFRCMHNITVEEVVEAATKACLEVRGVRGKGGGAFGAAPSTKLL